MNHLKENIGFLLVCLVFGALALIGINGVAHTSSGPPDHSEMVYTMPAHYDFIPVYTEDEIDQSFADEGLITYAVDRDAQIYKPESDDIVLKPRSLLHRVQYTDDTETVTDINPNPIDLINDVKDIKKVTSWEQLLTYESSLSALLILILGYLSKWIPGFNMINSGFYRVGVLAVFVIIILTSTGYVGGWQGVIGYAISTIAYLFIKPVAPSPKPKE